MKKGQHSNIVASSTPLHLAITTSSPIAQNQVKLPNITATNDTKVSKIIDESMASDKGDERHGFHVGVCTQKGRRPYQEDEYCVKTCLSKSSTSETHMFCIFDGHAGGHCSKYLTANLYNVLKDDILYTSNIVHAIKRSFYVCNENFLKIAERLKLSDGSTGLVSIIRDNKIIVSNVGDCRALLLSDGKHIPMSNDQKPTMIEEQKRIASFGGNVLYCMGVARVNGVLAVSRAFGNRSLRQVIRPDPEIIVRELSIDDDYLVMASDGLWDTLSSQDVCNLVYNHISLEPHKIAEELVRLAYLKGSTDNCTCLVVNIHEYVTRIMKSTIQQHGVHGVGKRTTVSDGSDTVEDAVQDASTTSTQSILKKPAVADNHSTTKPYDIRSHPSISARNNLLLFDGNSAYRNHSNGNSNNNSGSTNNLAQSMNNMKLDRDTTTTSTATTTATTTATVKQHSSSYNGNSSQFIQSSSGIHRNRHILINTNTDSDNNGSNNNNNNNNNSNRGLISPITVTRKRPTTSSLPGTMMINNRVADTKVTRTYSPIFN